MKIFQWISLWLFVLLLIGSTTLNAQKIGYLDYELFLSNLPEVKEANGELEGIKAEYYNKGQKMIAEYQQKVKILQGKAGDLSPKNLEIEAEQIKEEELKIVNFEKEMTTVLNQKTQELINPIQTKLLKAIAEVAKENGYLYIFNAPSSSSTNLSLSFYEKKGDVSKLVLAKYNEN